MHLICLSLYSSNNNPLFGVNSTTKQWYSRNVLSLSLSASNCPLLRPVTETVVCNLNYSTENVHSFIYWFLSSNVFHRMNEKGKEILSERSDSKLVYVMRNRTRQAYLKSKALVSTFEKPQKIVNKKISCNVS